MSADNATPKKQSWLRLSLHSFLVVMTAICILGCWKKERSLTIHKKVASPMNDEKVWNEESRQELRENIRTRILGELRLAKSDHDEILQSCYDIYIVDDPPEEEQEDFKRFAAEELQRADARLEVERKTWPDSTDNDRLDRVEKSLQEIGIILWQASPCCDSCTMGEFQDRIDHLNTRYPGLADRVRGYAFFIDQNMPESLVDSTEISVYLGYGWFSPDGSEVPPEAYEQNALSIAREVVECLRKESFEPDWNGSFSKKIGVSLNWRRRTLLE